MYNQFDDKLSGRIKDVFENFEDDSADFGWAELRKRFPGEEKRKSLAAWWWSSAAAIILVTIGAISYYYTSSPQTNYSAKKNSHQTLDLKESQKVAESSKPEKTVSAEDVNTLTNTARTYTSGKSRSIKAVSVNAAVKIEEVTPARQEQFSAAEPAIRPDEDTQALVLKEEQRVVSVNSDGAAIAKPVNESSGDALERAIVNDMLQKRDLQAALSNSLEPLAENPKTQKKRAKHLSIGVFAGSYFNYAEGSESSMNTGVGISSEIGITKKFKVTTGLSIAQNTLKYKGEIPQTAASDFRSVVAMDESPKMELGFANISAPSIPATYSISNYNASLLGLDIPINLKYTLLQSKNELYLSAGVSSNFFIEESYSYSYQLTKGGNSSVSIQEDNNASSKFQNFDFARMLNFSVGFGHPIGKQSRLSFEPFMKYPIGGQGARDLRFGAAGMNIKLNFGRLGL